MQRSKSEFFTMHEMFTFFILTWKNIVDSQFEMEGAFYSMNVIQMSLIIYTSQKRISLRNCLYIGSFKSYYDT